MANPITIIGSATRHVADINVALGRPSTRWNARNEYRTGYNPDEKLGAGLGTVAGAAFPATALIAWVNRGGSVGGVNLEGVTGIARFGRAALSKGPVIAWGAAATAVGVKRTLEMAHDDGNYSKFGTFVGMETGFLLANRVMHRGPLASMAAFAAGGVAGNVIGRQFKLGDGHKEPYGNNSMNLTGSKASLAFARGLGLAVIEGGPLTQGISFGNSWKMRDAFVNEYSSAEQAGAMTGDLTSAVILGGGALGTAASLIAARRGGEEALKSTLAGKVLLEPMNKLQTMPGAKAGLYAMGAGLAGYAVALNTGMLRGENRSTTQQLLLGAATVGVTAAAAKMISGSGALQHMNAGVRPAAATMTAALLISALSSARVPIQQFLRKADDAGKGRDGTTTAALAGGGVGVAAGAFAGMKIAKAFGSSATGWKKGAISAAAVGVGAVGGGLMGTQFSPLMPKNGADIAKAAGVGLVLGAGTTLLKNNHSWKAAATMGVVGAALGVIASPMLADSPPVKAAEE